MSDSSKVHFGRNVFSIPLRVGSELAWVAGYIPRCYAHTRTVTNPKDNRTRCRVSSLLRPTPNAVTASYTAAMPTDVWSLLNGNQDPLSCCDYSFAKSDDAVTSVVQISRHGRQISKPEACRIVHGK